MLVAISMAVTCESTQRMKKPLCKSCARRRAKLRRALKSFNKWRKK